MGKSTPRRREFIRAAAAFAAVSSSGARGALGQDAPAVQAGRGPGTSPARLKFAVIGLNHDHIYSLVADVLRGGGELVTCYAKEPDLLAAFTKRYPQARTVRDEREILEDAAVRLVLSAAIPDERGPLALRVMRHGKDFMVDKPAVTSLEQLAEVRRVQAETRRIFSVEYGRLADRALSRAADLVEGGAIGRVVQTIGLGPHRMNPSRRPPWFFERPRYGGILCDLASHQADQFLFFTRSTRAEVVASRIATLDPQYPGLETFGDMMVTGDGGTGYARVDWLTPAGLGTWGDGRFVILGLDGFVEIRQNVDIAGRPGGNHLFLVDQKGTRHVDCNDQPLPYGERLVSDVLDRTETAMSQAHCLLATELALRAEVAAQRVSLPPRAPAAAATHPRPPA